MTNINSFQSMLAWKLKAGSHAFPGDDGGTCINEAAIVAAGLPYRKVGEANDLPECFSRPIAKFALVLNDTMPSRIRQKLLRPFVLRLAGTADEPAVEDVRSAFIVTQCMRTVLTLGLNHDCEYLLHFDDALARPVGILADLASQYANEASLTAELSLSGKLEQAIELMKMAELISLTGGLVTAKALASCIKLIAATSRRPTKVYRRAVEILDQAIKKGRHQEISVVQASQRMQTARENGARDFAVSMN